MDASLLLALCFMPCLHAAELYRIIDENGKVVYTDRLPPSQTKKGYGVLDCQGREKDKVAPEVSAEVRAEQERQRVAQETAKRAQEEQIRREDLLLQLYGSEDAIKEARESMLQTTQSKIKLHEMNVYSTEERIKYLSAQTVQDKSTMDEMKRLKKTLAMQRCEMQKLDAEKDAVSVHFDKIQAQWCTAKARYESLHPKVTSQAPSLSSPTPTRVELVDGLTPAK